MKSLKLKDGRVVELFCDECDGVKLPSGDRYFYFIDNDFDLPEEDRLLFNRDDDRCPGCNNTMLLKEPLNSIPLPYTENDIVPQELPEWMTKLSSSYSSY